MCNVCQTFNIVSDKIPVTAQTKTEIEEQLQSFQELHPDWMTIDWKAQTVASFNNLLASFPGLVIYAIFLTIPNLIFFPTYWSLRILQLIRLKVINYFPFLWHLFIFSIILSNSWNTFALDITAFYISWHWFLKELFILQCIICRICV